MIPKTRYKIDLDTLEKTLKLNDIDVSMAVSDTLSETYSLDAIESMLDQVFGG